MPRVTDDHLERRRQQILDAARICFLRKGFHRTSMQDVFAESGLSAGAVYRYFKSKNEIIHAIATERQSGAIKLLETIVKEDPLPPFEEIIERFFGFVQTILDEDGALRVAPQVWAEALHDPVYQAIVADLFKGVRGSWAALATRMRDAGRLPEDADPEAVGVTLMCTMPGFVLQRMLNGDIDARTIRAGFHALGGAR
ncbi:TetR/AcrR family transcriptional regulator [Actinomadura sp. DC4]|uniref:TetR/AcrR family transcriptional regulator n=1 Tax=Actinomadura sp. DC4 TaxID=3055069 RepID=UPI0025B01A8F|nr:TetR/AcrR family transcriptional regulator [Actinomadura sp. DC4]MDN3353521.1 TetR/AcrR family transcriptional regulator [Actinomadura sp. DC4]